MKVTASAVSLNVADVRASAAFLTDHFGFAETMTVERDVASLARDDVGYQIVLLRTGLDSFKPAAAAGSAGAGLLLVFVVEDIDGEYRRIRAEGAPVVTPIETEPWGERYFQVRDPNGLIVQLVQWVTGPPEGPTGAVGG